MCSDCLLDTAGGNIKQSRGNSAPRFTLSAEVAIHFSLHDSVLSWAKCDMTGFSSHAWSERSCTASGQVPTEIEARGIRGRSKLCLLRLMKPPLPPCSGRHCACTVSQQDGLLAGGSWACAASARPAHLDDELDAVAGVLRLGLAPVEVAGVEHLLHVVLHLRTPAAPQCSRSLFASCLAAFSNRGQGDRERRHRAARSCHMDAHAASVDLFMCSRIHRAHQEGRLLTTVALDA